MIIEFKLPKEVPVTPIRHDIRRKRELHRGCLHPAFLVDQEGGKVFCKQCEKEIDPIETLLIVGSALWRNEWKRERDVEDEQKRVSKVQKAAVECLFNAGITPEEYARRFAKLQAERAQAEAAKVEEIKTKVVPIDSDGAA